MTTTFAIDVIQTFQAAEEEAFKDFLNSPYFIKGTNDEPLKALFELLYKAIQNGEIAALSKMELHAQIFPGKPFLESKIDKLMSELKRYLEKFLLVQRYFYDQNESKQLLDLSAEMRVRGLESRYHQVLDKTKKHPDASGQESLKRLFFRFQLAMEEQEWQSTYNKGKGDLNIPETIRHLDTYYLAHKTWMLNHLMFMQKSSSIPVSIDEMEQNMLDLPLSALEHSVFLEICWKVHVLLKNGDYKEADFQILLKDIQDKEQQLSPESISDFYIYLRNFCVLLIDSGYTQIRSILHEIHKDNLERGYFYTDGKIFPNGYLSITQTALNVGAIEWLKGYVEQHKDIILGENDTKDFYRMNKAMYLFGEQKYQEALDTIPFGSTYSFYHLMARRLELKIYYELRSDLLDHKIDAFKMFISRAGRKVFSENLHELFTNFVNFVRQLNQSHGPQAKQRSQVLIKRINEKKMVAERLWLLEKAKELGEKK